MPPSDPLIPDYGRNRYEQRRRRPISSGEITALVFAILAAPFLLFASWFMLFPEYGSEYGVMCGLCGAIPLSLVAGIVAALSLRRIRDNEGILAKYAALILVCLWATAILSFAALRLLHQ